MSLLHFSAVYLVSYDAGRRGFVEKFSTGIYDARLHFLKRSRTCYTTVEVKIPHGLAK